MLRLDERDDLDLEPMSARERVMVALAIAVTIGWVALLVKGWWWSW